MTDITPQNLDQFPAEGVLLDKIIFRRANANSITVNINGIDYDLTIRSAGSGFTVLGDGTTSGGLLTIASGSVTATTSYHGLQSESGLSDDLDTIVTTGITDGSLLVLHANSSIDDITVKDGTGNIKLAGGDFLFSHTDDTLTLMKQGSTWVELSRSDNTA